MKVSPLSSKDVPAADNDCVRSQKMVTGAIATLVQLPKRWHCPTLEAIFMAPVTIRRHV